LGERWQSMMIPPHSERAGEVRVVLPWPDRMLSPNARVHWSQKAKVVRAARNAAWALSLEAKVPRMSVSARPRVEIEFCPPDRRRRDTDNCIASAKASMDGLADALGVDDSRFISTYRMADPVKGGAVIVTVRGIE